MAILARSPVFTHMTASLQGLTTIRAFGAEEILRIEFDQHQDLHSSAFYMFLGCKRAFGFWLDMHCVIYVAFVTLSFLIIDTGKFCKENKKKYNLLLQKLMEEMLVWL